MAQYSNSNPFIFPDGNILTQNVLKTFFIPVQEYLWLIFNKNAKLLPIGKILMNTLHKTHLFQNTTSLGKFLKTLRKEMRLTQAEAAGLCNVGLRFLIELEAGKPTAQIGKTFQVLQGYGLVVSVSAKSLSLKRTTATERSE
jgi:DNA-binding XRE family transcriptional regulator